LSYAPQRGSIGGMHITAPLAALMLLTSQAPATPPQADPARLKADVEKLVSFGTRHTLSSATDPKRGIGAARTWGAAELNRIGKACGECITISRVSLSFSGPRAPDGVIVENILGIQPGTGDPNHVVIIAGHIDSRASDPLDFTSDAPGANDNGSGSALVLEAARLLSKSKHRATIVYALLSGEEQGLWGGQLLVKDAGQRGWTVLALLNNDIVGGTKGTEGRIVADRVRVFSEGIRMAEDLPGQKARRAIGGEDDGPSRALAKAAREVAGVDPDALDVLLVRRPDRFRRGGDHLPALEAGLPAIRFSVGIEDYDHQHQDVRVEAGRKYGDTADEMDFAYLARVTDLNVAVAARLAGAPPAPGGVVIDGAVSSDTTVRWHPVAGAAGYRIVWRRTDTDRWTDSIDVGPDAVSHVLKDIIIDDHFFGVAALGDGGAASIVSFGGLAVAP
jgi:Peptidase family M28